MKSIGAAAILLLLAGCSTDGATNAETPPEPDRGLGVPPEDITPTPRIESLSETVVLSQANANDTFNSFILGPEPNCIRFNIPETLKIYNISIVSRWAAESEASKSLRMSFKILDKEGAVQDEKVLAKGGSPLSANIQNEIEISRKYMVSVGIHPDAPGVAFSQDVKMNISLIHSHYESLEAQLIGCTI